MRIVWFIVLSTVGALIGCYTVPEASHKAATGADQRCGWRALELAAALNGVEVDGTELGEPCERPASMYSLRQTARQYGFEADARTMSWEQLVESRRTAILLVDHHYIVADARRIKETAGQAHIQAFDPPHSGRWISKSELGPGWRGHALLIEKNQELTPPGPRLELETLIADFGSTLSQGIFERSIGFRNAGSTPLRIIDIRKSCGCTDAQTDREWYGPGETGMLVVRVDLNGREGKQEQEVHLLTNAQPSSVTLVKVQGSVINPIEFSSQIIDFGPMARDENATIELSVRDRGDGRLKLEWIGWQLDGPEHNSGIEAIVSQTRAISTKGEQTCMLSMRVKENAPYGVYQGRVRFRTNYESFAEVELPFVVRIGPAIRVGEKTIALGKLGALPRVRVIPLELTRNVSGLDKVSVSVLGNNKFPLPDVQLTQFQGSPALKVQLPPAVEERLGRGTQVNRGTIEVTDTSREPEIIDWYYLF